MNIKPVSHEEVAQQAKEGRLKQSFQQFVDEVADTLTSDTNKSPNESPNPLIIEENECATCHKQFDKAKNLKAHLKANKTTDCKAITCKVEHDHDYKIIKFESAEEAKSFGKTFGTGFTLKSAVNDLKNIRSNCREKGCAAKWSSQQTERPSGKIEYVFRGCLAHNPQCKYHVNNVTDGKSDCKTNKKFTHKKTFDNWDRAMDYFYKQAQDSLYLLQNLRFSNEGSLMKKEFICHRSGIPVQKPGSKNDSKKIGCTSKCSMSSTRKGIEFAGDFSHNHEEFDLARLGKKQTEYISKMLRVGTIDTVMDELTKHPEENPTGKFLSRRVVWRIKRDKVPGDCDLNIDEGVNVHNYYGKHKSLRSFQARRFFGEPPAEIAGKEIQTTDGNVMLAFCSERQLQIFKDNPRNIYVDGSHNTNQAGYPLVTVMVPNKFGIHEAVFQAVVEHENKDMIKHVFEELRKLAPEECAQVKTLTSDLFQGYIDAFREVVGDNGPDHRVRYIPCKWHVERAWTNNIKSDRLLGDLKALILEPNQNIFEARLAQLEEKYLNSPVGNEEREWDYFKRNYGHEGVVVKPKQWARSYTSGAISHNLHIEAYHSRIKKILKAGRMDVLIKGLLKFERDCSYWAMGREKGIPGKKLSPAQKKFLYEHQGSAGYSVQRVSEGEYLVTKQGGGWRDHKQYTVKRNDIQPCNDMLSCKVKCKECGQGQGTVCWHTYKCYPCPRYNLIGACKHQHMLPPQAYDDAIAWRLRERGNEPQSTQNLEPQSVETEIETEVDTFQEEFDNASIEVEDRPIVQREENTPTALSGEANRVCALRHMPFKVPRPAQSTGSCFFHAVVILARHPEIYPTLSEEAKKAVKDPLTLRKKTVDFIANNIELLLHGFVDKFKISALEMTEEMSEDEKEQRWQKYLSEMRSPFTFADDTVVQATSLYLGKDILYLSNRHSGPENPWTVVEGSYVNASFKASLPPLTLCYLNQRHFEPLQRNAPAGIRECKGCNWSGNSLQSHLSSESDTMKKCKYFYSDVAVGVNGMHMNVSQDVNDEVSVNATGTESIREETESSMDRTVLSAADTLLLQELESARDKLIQGAYTKYDKQSFSNFFGKKGSTPKRVRKRKERDETEQQLNSEFPMRIPRKKKKNTKPKRGKDFMKDKDAKDLKDLLEIPIKEFFWCFEVCKGYEHFTSKAINLEPKVRGKLFKMFKEAKSHWKCQKCETHSVELANTQFIYCDNCNDIFHGACVGKDLEDEEVLDAEYRCENCSD